MSWRTFHRPAVIVAESLRRLPEPPFVPGPAANASGRAVAAAIARSLAPPVAAEPSPAWLRESQRPSFSRALAAIRKFRVAMVADPVGSGKTWIALALAKSGPDQEAVVIGPSVLRDQWNRAAARAEVRIAFQSHEQWSRRGVHLPGGLVIIDESHRFRHPWIRRYDNLARVLAGREGVLLTATPAVNGLVDLAHQLLLFARDDCLAGAGIPSLLETLERGEAPPALADLVITGAPAPGRPAVAERTIPAGEEEERDGHEILEALGRLRLSPVRGTAALISGVFAASLASSRAALLTTLGRYRNLLLQGGDASRAGVRLGRRELASLLGREAEQTVLWSLLDVGGDGSDLVAEDLPRLEACIDALRERARLHEPKVTRLASFLDMSEVSVVFTGARATVDALRRSLTPASRVAWVSGSGAGIGPIRLARRDVLRWFGPRAPEHALGPRILITTDVLAEGLDLQRARRIVHFDLPWTAVRLDQRAGRAVRLGSTHAGVEIVTMLPPPVLETRLQLLDRLARKRPLPALIGLGQKPEPVWEWRTTLARRPVGDAETGAVIVDGDADAELVAVELRAGDLVVSSFSLARRGSAAWCTDHRLVSTLIEQAATGATREPDGAVIARTLAAAQRGIRSALLGASGALWRVRPVQGYARAALRRVQGYAREAIRRRDRPALAMADRGIAFLRRGQTAGERLLTQRIGESDDAEFERILAGLPRPDRVPPPLRARITGVVIVRAPPARS
ncbi:MAG TPA: DEAD/DEAH box helicase [Gemmatimonadales bacterium]|nr:DEAD/DEAH box helicase [Gemmatimonadales bacterium]